MTRLEAYQDTLEFLEQAVSALDQAWSSARDAGLQDETPTPGKHVRWESGHVSYMHSNHCLDIEQVTASAQALLNELRERSECPECYELLAAHANPCNVMSDLWRKIRGCTWRLEPVRRAS